MNKENMMHILRSAKIFASKRSPEILTGIGIAGMVTTTVLAVKATPKAMQLIEEAGYKKGSDENPTMDVKFAAPLTTIEKVKVAWKPYFPAAVIGVSSVVCLIGACSVNTRRVAALTAAYQISETAISEYRDKVIDFVGEKKEKVIRDRVSEEKVKNNPVNKNNVVITSRGNTLCLDPISGRYFRSDIDKIKKAENELNKRMIHDIVGYISLNDFYDELELSHIDVGYDLGWNSDELIDLDFSSQITEENEPCIVIDYLSAPKYNYDKF